MKPSRTNPPSINPAFAAFPLRVRRSRVHRWGVFAVRRIPSGRKVIEFAGERISRRVALSRLKLRLRPGRPHFDMFRLDSYWRIDPVFGGSGAELINHSCAPNLRARIVRGHILFFSRRRIRAGEELSLDYRISPDTFRVRCRCGAPNCRGFLNISAS